MSVQAMDRSTERRLWFGILAAPTMWTVAELVGVATVGRTCGAVETSLAGVRGGGMPVWQWLLVMGTQLLAAAISAWALYMSWRVFRQRTGPVRITEAEGWNRVEFMAVAGVIISAFLLLNILYFAIMPAILDPCLRAA